MTALNLHTLNTLPHNHFLVHVLRMQGENMHLPAPRHDPFQNLRMLSADPFPVCMRVQLVELSLQQHGALAHYIHMVGMVRE